MSISGLGRCEEFVAVLPAVWLQMNRKVLRPQNQIFNARSAASLSIGMREELNTSRPANRLPIHPRSRDARLDR